MTDHVKEIYLPIMMRKKIYRNSESKKFELQRECNVLLTKGNDRNPVRKEFELQRGCHVL